MEDGRVSRRLRWGRADGHVEPEHHLQVVVLSVSVFCFYPLKVLQQIVSIITYYMYEPGCGLKDQ